MKDNILEREFLLELFPAGFAERPTDVCRIARRKGLFSGEAGEIVNVEVAHIFPCQDYLNKQRLNELLEDRDNSVHWDPPMGVKLGEDVFLIDGHHRASALISFGNDTISMKVIEITKEEWEDEIIPTGIKMIMRRRHLIMQDRQKEIKEIKKQGSLGRYIRYRIEHGNNNG